MMRSSTKLFGTLAFGAALAACGPSAAPIDDDLARDLEKVGSSSLELAPVGAGTQVISAIEQSPEAPAATPAPAPARARVAQSAPRPRQPQVRTPAPQPRAVEQAPVVAAEAEVPQPSAASGAPAPRPTNPPLGAGAPPPGGWRNINDVIRNSRVPITP